MKKILVPFIASLLLFSTLFANAGTKRADNFEANESFVNKEQVATPSSPATGKQKLYFKDDEKLYKLNSSGTETQLGVSDHGDLTGLVDDDHTQYHTDADGDARYFQESEFKNSSAGAADSGKPLKLDAGGHIDESMINETDIDHNNIINNGTNTHAQIDTHVGSVANPHSVTKAQVGLTEVPDLKQNLSAIVDPVVTDDSGSGYGIGSRWMNTVGDKSFVCLDASVGTAVWKDTTAGSAGGDPDQDLFNAFAGDSGTNPFADTTTESLSILGGPGLSTLGDSGTDTITINRTLASQGEAEAGTEDTKGMTALLTAQAIQSLSPSQSSSENGLLNPGFRVVQRGTNFTSATPFVNNDDTYLFDRWILLSDGNDIVDVSQETTIVPAGAYASGKSLVATINKKFGYLQIIEAKDAARFIGKTASLSFKTRTTTGAVLGNLRAHVLSWDSTEDVVTSDVVSAWGAVGVNPTFVANWTAENVAVNLPLNLDSFTTHTIEDIDIDTSGAKNIAVFIHLDDTDAALNDVFYISDVQLETGASATDFSPRLFLTEKILAERFYRTVTTAMGNAWTTVTCFLSIEHPNMRITPVASVDGPITINNGPLGKTQSSANVSGTGDANGGRYAFANFSGLAATAVYNLPPGGGVIQFDAEL